MRILLAAFPLFWMACLQADPRFNQELPREEPTVAAADTVRHFEVAIYDSAIALFKEKRFADCEARFRVLVDSFPQTQEAEKAGYMLGYLYTHVVNPKISYIQAKLEFDRFLKSYPDSRYVSDSRSWIRAIAIMDSLEKRPTTVKGNNSALIDENRRLKAEIQELKQVIERLERIIKKN